VLYYPDLSQVEEGGRGGGETKLETCGKACGTGDTHDVMAVRIPFNWRCKNSRESWPLHPTANSLIPPPPPPFWIKQACCIMRASSLFVSTSEVKNLKKREEKKRIYKSKWKMCKKKSVAFLLQIRSLRDGQSHLHLYLCPQEDLPHPDRGGCYHGNCHVPA